MGTRVYDVDWYRLTQKRAGIIPYMKISGTLIFGFGVDSGLSSIIDFGGCRKKYDVDLIDTAINEFITKSMSVFGHITRDDVQNCHCIWNTDTIEIFVPVSCDPLTITGHFHKMVGDNSSLECQNIIWVTRAQLIKALQEQHTQYMGVNLFLMHDCIHSVLSQHQNEILCSDSYFTSSK